MRGTLLWKSGEKLTKQLMFLFSDLKKVFGPSNQNTISPVNEAIREENIEVEPARSSRVLRKNNFLFLIISPSVSIHSSQSMAHL